jgi:ribulose-phosphate 3-epimerase
MQIIPAILPKNIEDIRQKLARVHGLCEWVQIDLTDGVFVPSTTWPYNGEDSDGFERILGEEEGLPYWADFNFEFDLMVKDATKDLSTFITMGAKRILFHYEAEDPTELRDFLEGIDPYIRENIEFGVAFSPSTPLESIYPLVPFLDGLQCMGSDTLGMHGVALDERIYDILRTLHSKYPDLPLCVDIGVNETTVPLLAAAGATRLAAGSMIWKSDDIAYIFEKFETL